MLFFLGKIASELIYRGSEYYYRSSELSAPRIDWMKKSLDRNERDDNIFLRLAIDGTLVPSLASRMGSLSWQPSCVNYLYPSAEDVLGGNDQNTSRETKCCTQSWFH